MTDFTLKPAAAAAPTQPAPEPASAGWGGDGFGFNDFLDLINPLHHLPGVGTLYRAVTGDSIADEARFIGHIVYGGPVGLIAATAETLATDGDGRGLSDNLAAWWRGGEGETAVAAHRPSAPGADSQATAATIAMALAPPTAQKVTAQKAAATNPATESGDLQQINGSLLDAFIQRQNRAPAELSSTALAPAALAPAAPASSILATVTPLAPPPTAGAADGTELAQWMMHALDRYRQQAGQR